MFEAWGDDILPACVACGDAIHDAVRSCTGCDGAFCDGCVVPVPHGSACAACARRSATGGPGAAPASPRIGSSVVGGQGLAPRALTDLMGRGMARQRRSAVRQDDDMSGC